jgi:hypothetical protein
MTASPTDSVSSIEVTSSLLGTHQPPSLISHEYRICNKRYECYQRVFILCYRGYSYTIGTHCSVTSCALKNIHNIRREGRAIGFCLFMQSYIGVSSPHLAISNHQKAIFPFQVACVTQHTSSLANRSQGGRESDQEHCGENEMGTLLFSAHSFLQNLAFMHSGMQ